MKQATCSDLRGACNQIITGNSAEEMANACKNHAMEMAGKQDPAHLEAMSKMSKLAPEEQQEWWQEFVEGFDKLEEAKEV